jgi:hypothetical protein
MLRAHPISLSLPFSVGDDSGTFSGTWGITQWATCVRVFVGHLFRCRRAMFALPFEASRNKIKDDMSLRRRSYAQAPVIFSNALSERFVPSMPF